MFRILIVVLGLNSGLLVQMQEIDSQQLKCLVCKSTIEELETELANIDPSKKIEVGNYRLDASGNVQQKIVSLRYSEVHISELLDNVCNKMDDYIRAKYKSTGELTILKIMGPDGGMNPQITNMDIIQDNDMNKSLKFYCENIVSEHEDSIVAKFSKESEDSVAKLCTDISHYCVADISQDDDVRAREEL